ncbi:UNVERIFIED_CONTAM: Vacuolar protein-sorting-associated protein 33 [Sesamum calycinum]|uniref:Vacuolar protein-sorting-associated protein 33 n=1 Tax=Sesamum calycinum TaxID=2727403 RepID=A0AAW2LT92_9LAMI
MTRHINLAQHLSTFTSKPSFLGRLDMEQTLVEAQSYDMRELLHSYGFEHIATLNNLEKAGLFRKQDSRSNWLTIKRALQLVVEDTDTAKYFLFILTALYCLFCSKNVIPNDISYVFSGYAPLSIRLVQQAIRSGWRPIEEILRLLPGPHSEIKRGGYASIPSYETLPGSLNSSEKLADGRRSLVLVVFIGGVTFAEISALRFLCSQEGMAYDLIVGTTKIVNGQTLTETFIEKLG